MSEQKKVVNWTLLIWMSFLFGWLGVDRFIVGKIGTGILKLITFGGFGIWYLIDLIMIMSSYKYKNIEWKFPKNKTVHIVIICVLLVIGLIGSFSGDNTPPNESNTPSNEPISQNQESTPKNSAPKEPEFYYAGDRVEVGNFAYTINSYYTTDKIGQDIVGTFMGEEADGIFLVLDVTIENIAKETKTMWGSYIKVIDEQERTFDHDTTAEIYLDESFSFEQMQPGLPKTGKVVFDVPKDLKGKLGISSDNMWSNEVKYVSWNKKE